jgi:hypothetical protein
MLPSVLPVLLAQLAGGSAVDLRVVYSDVHPLWGGVSITVDGSGAWQRSDWEPGDAANFARSGTLTRTEIAALGQLLLDIRAWEQVVPAAPPVPDESRATLALEAADERSSIWERFNDLEAGRRIGLVRDMLTGATAPGRDADTSN